MSEQQHSLFSSISANLPEDPDQLDKWLGHREDTQYDLKENSRAGILWADPDNKGPTSYSLVYIHGFTAGPEEGAPVHDNVAAELGMNLYKSRLAGHGLRHIDAMAHLTSEDMVESAVEALAIGKKLGHKVILMGTSTGGALALYLAAHYPDIAALILYSPLVNFRDFHSRMLTNSWGRRLTKYFLGGRYLRKKPSADTDESSIWNETYRAEAAIALGFLVKDTMTRKTFSKIKQPTFLGYYYKNKEHQDTTVSVEAMIEMFGQIKTPDSLKRSIAFPHAGSHVICSDVTSDSYQEVQKATIEFLKDVLPD